MNAPLFSMLHDSALTSSLSRRILSARHDSGAVVLRPQGGVLRGSNVA